MIKTVSFILFCFLSVLFFSTNHFEKNSRNNETFLNYNNQDTIDINDGPYIFIKNDSLIVKNIINGEVESKVLNSPAINTNFTPDPSVYTNISKIAAISDFHGQYDLTISILKNNGIIDDNLNWAFGNGHLVIVGDIFDRGPKVTELLWFVFYLEKQAVSSGGKVHFLMGNHEYMVMQNDLRYLNKKYRYSSFILKTPYNELYNKQTLLGKWLRSKSTILKINDNLFVHGGISIPFIEHGFDLEQTNQFMRQSLNTDENEKSWDSIYGKYYNDSGPIWYRGYFSEEFKKAEINKLLRKLEVNHIIVGHTSFNEILSLFDNKILAVDSSIKNGSYGEILFIEDGNFYRGSMDGKKNKLE